MGGKARHLQHVTFTTMHISRIPVHLSTLSLPHFRLLSRLVSVPSTRSVFFTPPHHLSFILFCSAFPSPLTSFRFFSSVIFVPLSFVSPNSLIQFCFSSSVSFLILLSFILSYLLFFYPLLPPSPFRFLLNSSFFPPLLPRFVILFSHDPFLFSLSLFLLLSSLAPVSFFCCFIFPTLPFLSATVTPVYLISFFLIFFPSHAASPFFLFFHSSHTLFFLFFPLLSCVLFFLGTHSILCLPYFYPFKFFPFLVFPSSFSFSFPLIPSSPPQIFFSFS